MSVDAATLERIKAVLSRRGVSPEDVQQTQVILRIFGGAKAFLLNQFTGKLYFFRGASYTRFDISRKEADTGYPRTLGNWPGLFSKDIDAACHLPNEHACFFSGKQFVKYDVRADHSLPGYPKNIDQASWPGLSFATVDACLNWRNEKLYFFSGDQYAAFDIRQNCQDPGYPRRIKDGWRLLGALMPNGIDSAVAFDGKGAPPMRVCAAACACYSSAAVYRSLYYQGRSVRSLRYDWQPTGCARDAARARSPSQPTCLQLVACSRQAQAPREIGPPRCRRLSAMLNCVPCS